MSDPASERTTLHRYAHRAAYDRRDHRRHPRPGHRLPCRAADRAGFPVVIPLAYGRVGDIVYLHGSAASRLFRRRATPSVEICMTVTFVDGLVVARSTYNTDINYRSVMIIGQATEVRDLDEKRRGLELAGRAHHSGPQSRRPPAHREGAPQPPCSSGSPSTESSAKIRTGWPADEEEDYDLHLGRRRPLHPPGRRPLWPIRHCASPSIPRTTSCTTDGGSVERGDSRCGALRMTTQRATVAGRRRTRPRGGDSAAMCGVVGLLIEDRSLEPDWADAGRR